MTDQLRQVLDIRADENTARTVELKVGMGSLSTVWVNIDGICRLRICNLRPDQITVDDERTVRLLDASGTDFAEGVEVVAKAIAWSKLTTLGRETCDWRDDFSELERTEFRARATLMLKLAGSQ